MRVTEGNKEITVTLTWEEAEDLKRFIEGNDFENERDSVYELRSKLVPWIDNLGMPTGEKGV